MSKIFFVDFLLLFVFFAVDTKKKPQKLIRGFFERLNPFCFWSLSFWSRFVCVLYYDVACSFVMLLVNHVDFCIVDQRFRPEEKFAVSVGDARFVGKWQFKFNCSHDS